MHFGEVAIPDSLINSVKDGNTVFFVGAGASVAPPSSLPGFQDLVENITQAAGDEFDSGERFDASLGRLADRGVDVHSLIAEQISTKESQPNQLHRAIVSIANTSTPLRIVTTNWDLHLDTCATAIHPSIDFYNGPALPPGDDFEGIVHLHGALGQRPKHLIATDADFGRAYLREGWAARFMERLLSTFNVVFLGYSYSDIVLQYLARSLPEGATSRQHFVFTDAPENLQWKRLRLTPIGYQTRSGSHEALPDALERWAHYASMGMLDHQTRINDVVQKGLPLTPEENSYLSASLENVPQLRIFTHAANTNDWLVWVTKQPIWNIIFHPEASSAAAILSEWIFAHFPDNMYAFSSIGTHPMGPDLANQIALQIISHEQEIPQHLIQWLIAYLAQSAPVDDQYFNEVLKCPGLAKYPDAAILLLENRTRSRISRLTHVGRTFILPEVTIPISAGMLEEAWRNVFSLIITTHGCSLLALLGQQLSGFFRTSALVDTSKLARSIATRRPSIESRPENGISINSADILIGKVRDILDVLCTGNPALAEAQIRAWTLSDEIILRRLAIYGWRKLEKDATTLLDFLIEGNWLWAVEERPEAFALLADILPHLDKASMKKLLTYVKAGVPDPITGAAIYPECWNDAYARYNLLIWINQNCRNDSAVTNALADEDGEFRSFTPRERPDLIFAHLPYEYQPLTASIDTSKQLEERFSKSAQGTISKIVQDLEALDTFEYTRGIVSKWVAQHPLRGLDAISMENGDNPDLFSAVVRGWQMADSDQLESIFPNVVAALKKIPQDIDIHPVAQLLGGSRVPNSIWTSRSESEDLARVVWDRLDMPARSVAVVDGSKDAFDDPAGQIAMFWILRTSSLHDRDYANWVGIPPELCAVFETMLNGGNASNQNAQLVLLTHLQHFYFWDPSWTRDHLLTKLDSFGLRTWGKEIWQRNWHAVLDGRQLEDDLFADGFMDVCLGAARADSPLRPETVNLLARTLAHHAIYSSNDPDEWVNKLARDGNAVFMSTWCAEIAQILSRLTAQETENVWSRWLGEYLRMRSRTLPRRPYPDESAQMARWVRFLPGHLEEATQLIMRMGAGLSSGGELIQRLTGQVKESPEIWCGFLENILSNTNSDMAPKFTSHSINRIIDALREASPEMDLSGLQDQCLRF